MSGNLSWRNSRKTLIGCRGPRGDNMIYIRRLIILQIRCSGADSNRDADIKIAQFEVVNGNLIRHTAENICCTDEREVW